MACFIAPMTVAIVASGTRNKINKRLHFDWLVLMLWGGTLMLIVDHIANGEVVPYFPFFTKSFSQIWPEIFRVGLPMTAVTISIWAVMVWVTIGLEKRKALAARC